MNLQKLKVPLNDIFNPKEKYTFLCGAGISMGAPTNLPSAREIGSCLISLCAPKEEGAKLLCLDTLRYEMIVEEVQKLFDSNLEFLDYFDLNTQPNIIHDFIATAIIEEHYVITTNFDYMIETALKKLLKPQNHSDIVPVITKQDYSTFQDPDKLIHPQSSSIVFFPYGKKKYPLYKIHGSKKNIITGKNTQESMITTISALGKNREQGKTFAIESFKKPATLNLLKDRTLVVMGYSGSDSFDISPMLKEMLFCKKLVWIDHTNCSTYNAYQVLIKISQNSVENSSKIDTLLEEIAMREMFPVFKIEVTTKDFIQNVLFSQIFNTSTQQSSNLTPPIEIPSFSKWIRTIKPFTHISEVKKFLFAGSLNHKLDQLNSAEQSYSSMWELIKNSQNDELKSHFFNNMGMIYIVKGDYEKGLEYFREALQIDIQLGNLKEKATDLNNIGMIFNFWGNNAKALEYYQEALQIDNQLGNLKGKATRLNNIGEICRNQGDYKKGLEYFREALHIDSQLGNLDGKSTRLGLIGMVYYLMSDFEKALEFYGEALQILNQLGVLKEKSVLLNNMGLVYIVWGDYKAALKVFQESLQISNQLEDLSGISANLSNIGMIFFLRGDYKKSMKFYQEALQINTQLGELAKRSKFLNNIGEIYKEQNDYEKALKYYQEAFQVNTQLEDLAGKANELTNIGTIYNLQGDNVKALKYYREALQINTQLGNLKEKATDFNNIGTLYSKQGDNENALKSYQEALQIDNQIGNLIGKSVDFNNIGEIWRKLGDYEKALKFYQEALQIDTQLGNLKGKAMVLNNIGMTFFLRGDYKKALKLYQEALQIDTRLGNLRGEATRLENIAVLYFQKLNDVSNALKCMQRLLIIYTTLGFSQKIQETHKVVEILKAQKNPSN
ncbi:MAG: tetratricopeptide repeat protein [Promethearchaeota archaeon]